MGSGVTREPASSVSSIMKNIKFGGFFERPDQVKHRFEWGEKSVPFDRSFDQGQIEIGTEREGQLIKLGATANKNFTGFILKIELIEAWEHMNARDRFAFPGQDEGGAMGKRFAD